MRSRSGPAQAARRLAILGLLLAAPSASALAQISPGPLSRPHEKLDEATSCFQCHGAVGEAMDGRCMVCHEDIAWLHERGRGIHGAANLGSCASCHPDHAGRDFALIEWGAGGQAGFDHARAGWPLSGSHAGLECRKCHQPENQVSVAATLSKIPSSRRWTGLETGCATCHQDVHGGRLGADCARCHEPLHWKPANGFDHSVTSFPLSGKHANVECQECHRPTSADSMSRFLPIAHESCASCHQDPHGGRLGPTCSGCHTTESFHRIPDGVFDHKRTRFPLVGAHRRVACARCHGEGETAVKRPAFSECSTCHADPHSGEATLAGKKVDCKSCHGLDSWSPSTMTVEQHASSSYPLEGRHRKVACASCHTKVGGKKGRAVATVRIRMSHGRCEDCHADAHAGQLAALGNKQSCEECHRVEGWRPSLFGAAEHAATILPLAGRHAKVACAACHGPDRPGLPKLPGKDVLGTARVALKPEESDCSDCHIDPHEGKLRREGGAGDRAGCRRCHDAVSFHSTRVGVEKHRTFRYPLQGAHRTVPCNDCHEELSARPGGSSLRLLARDHRTLTFLHDHSLCSDCHENPHGEQFAGRAGGAECSTCHGLERFVPADRFDHEKSAAFPLKGAHARVACDRCHGVRIDAAGKRHTLFRPTPTRCEACHTGSRASLTSGRGTP